MRTVDLLKAFSEIELKEITKAVSENKRPGLAILLRELKAHIKNESEPDNAQLFKKVFGKAYTKQQDYLLRNELRLLNKILYDQLIMATFRQEADKSEATYNQWLMKGLFQRRIAALFEADIDKSIRDASKETKPYETAMMYYYKSCWLIDHLPRTHENLKSHMELLDDYTTEEKRGFLQRIREIESQRAYLQLSLDFLNNSQMVFEQEDRRTKGQEVFDLSELARTDWYVQYQEIKKHVFETNRHTNIEVLKQKLAIESAEERSSFFTVDTRIFTLGHLAREHILLNQFEETDKYHRQMVALSREHNRPMRIGHLQNYIGNQLFLKRYANGINIYREYEKSIRESYLYASISILCSFCYLFLGMPDEALAFLPPSARMTPTDQLLSRMIYPIAFFMRGDLALAITECHNLKRAAKTHDGGDDMGALQNTVGLLSQFFSAYTKDKYTRKKEMQPLRSEVAQRTSKNSSFHATEFALLWMQEQFEKE